MPLKLANRVKETSLSSGSGVITLDRSIDGYQQFSSVLSSGDTTYYTIVNSSDWEVGIGTYGSSTLSRDVILSSSNSNNLLDLSGQSFVFIAYPSEKSVYKDVNDQVIVGSSGIIIESGIPSNVSNVLYNNNGTLYFNGSDLIGINDVIEDTSPQLGGDLDLNNNDLIGTGNIDINGTINAISGVYNDVNITGDIYAPSIGQDVDNTVVILNSSNYLKTDEIDSRVWGSTLADTGDIAAVSGYALNLFTKTYQNITSDTILSIDDDYIFVDSTSNEINLNMPIASGNGGKEIKIKRAAGDNLVNVNASGLENIDGALSYTMYHLYQSITLVSNNSNWFIT